MSLIHFTITNPGWKPSVDSEKYLTGLRNCADKVREAAKKYFFLVSGLLCVRGALRLRTLPQDH